MTLTRFAPSPSAPPGLKVSFHIEGPSTVVVVRCDVDVAAVPDLVDMLTWLFGKFDGPVVVDLAETGFIDTAAVRVLARAHQFLGDYGRSLTLPFRQGHEGSDLLVCPGELARGGGLEPPMTGPEPVVLPITPPPKGVRAL